MAPRADAKWLCRNKKPLQDEKTLAVNSFVSERKKNSLLHRSFGLKFGKPEPTREPLFAQILPNILKMIYAIDSTKQHPFLIRPLSLKNRNVPFLSLAKALLR